MAGGSGGIEPSSDGSLVLASGHRIEYRVDPDLARSVVPTEIVASAYSQINAQFTVITAIRHDDQLSEKAKAAKIEAVEDELLGSIVKAQRDFETFEQRVTAAELEMMAPPEIKADHAVPWLKDQELRGHLSKQVGPQRTAMLESMLRGQDDDMVLAVRRSPYNLGSDVTMVAEERWKQIVKAKDPTKAEHLAAFRRSQAWGNRVLAQMVGAVNSVTKADARRLQRIRDKFK